jgi:RNA polymerase sigma factor for flagellar operon FliA
MPDIEKYNTMVERIGGQLYASLPASVQFDDLVQAGWVGLMEAARNYDDSRGASFETHAGIRVRGAMIDELRRSDWAPKSVRRNARSLAKAQRDLEARLPREATHEEIAGEMGLEVDKYFSIRNDVKASQLHSYEDIDATNETRALIVGRAEGPEQEILKKALRDRVYREIEALPDRQRYIVKMRFNEEKSFVEIGDSLGVQGSGICAACKKATTRLRTKLSGFE